MYSLKTIHYILLYLYLFTHSKISNNHLLCGVVLFYYWDTANKTHKKCSYLEDILVTERVNKQLKHVVV